MENPLKFIFWEGHEAVDFKSGDLLWSFIVVFFDGKDIQLASHSFLLRRSVENTLSKGVFSFLSSKITNKLLWNQ